MKKKFYDIHYHLFDLSHPNLLAFILRDDLIDRKTVKDVLAKFPFLLRLMPLWAVSIFSDTTSKKIKDYIRNDAKNLRNLLSVMEVPIEYHFLYIEYFLLKEKGYFGLSGNPEFNKMVLCPLLLDFGYKNLKNPGCYYNLPPAKPIINQVVDVFNAIWFYFNYDLSIHTEKEGRLKIIPTSSSKDEKLFEIYPFLGINTKNYDLDEIVALFDKYFMGYESDDPAERKRKLYEKMGVNRITLDEMFSRVREKDGNFYSYMFAGIKLYPPVGFDPWPEEEPKELEKVKFVYSECIRKKIPVTVHCSDRGYITCSESSLLTDPGNRWTKVISKPEYRDLKINFAHLGSQHDGRTGWRDTIISLMKENTGVYSDCSCQTIYEKDYEIVRKVLTPDSENKILFGSDFVINLIWSASYNEYLNNFLNTGQLTSEQKELMCVVNPEKFIFG